MRGSGAEQSRRGGERGEGGTGGERGGREEERGGREEGRERGKKWKGQRESNEEELKVSEVERGGRGRRKRKERKTMMRYNRGLVSSDTITPPEGIHNVC